MQAHPIWPVNRRFGHLDGNTKADITVVGGGIVGIFSAYYLQKAGYDVVVLEADEVGSAATGASSGILYYGNGVDLSEASTMIGKKNAQIVWKETAKTMKVISDLIEKEGLEADIRKLGAVMTANNEKELQNLKSEKTLLDKLGIRSDVITGREISDFYTGQKFHAALHFPDVYQIHPAIFAESLARKFGIRVFESTKFISFEDGIVTTDKARVKSSMVLFATNIGELFGIEKHFLVESSVGASSLELGGSALRKIWPQDKIIWTSGEKYDIIYPAHNRLILEVFDLKAVKERFPAYYKDHKIDQQWGDSWATTKDRMPIADKIGSDSYAAVAMGDQGIAMGSTVACRMPDIIKGKRDDFTALCSVSRLGGL